MTLRNRMAIVILASLAAGHAAVASEVATPSQSIQAVDNASPHLASTEFVLVNATSDWLYLFIDGRRSVSVPPGDQGVDYVTVGTHSFRAETPDGRSVSRTGYVDEGGVTWTVSEE